MGVQFFLDTSYAIAPAAPTDQLHGRAVSLANRLEAQQIHRITTQAVLLEIGNALSKRRHRTAAISLLAALVSDPAVEVVPLSPGLFGEAFDLYRARPDKEWGLIGCVSFVVMKRYDIEQALTADEHFVQAGFRALLRDP